MQEKLLTVAAAVLALLLAGLAFFWQPRISEAPLPRAAGPVGGDFTLQAAAGPVSLHDFRGKLTLLYFGYTYCPDVCPTSLAATSAALQRLSASERQQVAMLFISVDPERDTPARLKEYAEFFDPGIIGATGEPAQLAEIAGRYGVFYARQAVDTAGNGYVVDHTADTLLVAPDGRLVGKIPHATPPEAVVAALRAHLSPS